MAQKRTNLTLEENELRQAREILRLLDSNLSRWMREQIRALIRKEGSETSKRK